MVLAPFSMSLPSSVEHLPMQVMRPSSNIRVLFPSCAWKSFRNDLERPLITRSRAPIWQLSFDDMFETYFHWLGGLSSWVVGFASSVHELFKRLEPSIHTWIGVAPNRSGCSSQSTKSASYPTLAYPILCSNPRAIAGTVVNDLRAPSSDCPKWWFMAAS